MCSLPGRSEKRETDFNASMRYFDASKAGAADDTRGLNVDRCEGKLSLAGTGRLSIVEEFEQIVRMRNKCDRDFPQTPIVDGIRKFRQVFLRQRFQSNLSSFKYDLFDFQSFSLTFFNAVLSRYSFDLVDDNRSNFMRSFLSEVMITADNNMQLRALDEI